MRRVVVTGMGAVSPFGIGREKLMRGVREGRSGVRFMPEWEAIDGLESRIAAPVPPFDARKLLPRSCRRTMGNMAMYAALAATEAREHAGIGDDLMQSGRVGIVMGSTTGSPTIHEEFYSQFVRSGTVEGLRSGTFFKVMGHTCAANTAQVLGLKGEQWSTVSACTSSIQAIGLGCLLIRSGRQDVVFCGGADETHYTVTMVFDVLKAASRKNNTPELTPRPFDSMRDGVVCGAGSGVLILESLEHALERGASPLVEILGFGNCNDTSHIANPGVDAMANAMRLALEDAGRSASELDYINAHATGTEAGDATEAAAINAVAGSNIPVSSFKGYIGHTLGAAGALETIILASMMEKGEIFPTLNLDEPATDCRCVRHVQQRTGSRLDLVLKNNFALGGVNSSLLIGRFRNGG